MRIPKVLGVSAISVTTASMAIVFAIHVSAQQTKKVENEVELTQTGSIAGQHNPPCGEPEKVFNAQDVVLKAGAAAIDAYIGAPIATPILDKVPPGNRDWLGSRLGIPRNGPSRCATLCVAYPKNVKARVEACMSETGRDGRDCATAPKDYDGRGDHQFGRFDSFTTASTDQTTVACVDGKNWSNNRNRWFTVTATY
jgi:hypothetical protein